MSEHKCHCHAPAAWFLRVVPTRQAVLVEGHLAETILADYAEDTWAVCHEHITGAAIELVARNDMTSAVLILRPEEE